MVILDFYDANGFFAHPIGDRWALAFPTNQYHDDLPAERLYLFPTRIGPTWRPHRVGTIAELAAEGLTFASREAALMAATWWWNSDALPHSYKKWLTLYPGAHEEAWRYGRLEGSE